MLQLLFNLSSIAFLVAVALLIGFSRPVTLPKRLFALFLALYAARQLGASLLPDEAGSRYFGDITLLTWWAYLAFLWVYPARPRLRSMHGAVGIAFAGTMVVYTALFAAARWPGTAAPAGALFPLASMAVSIANFALLGSALLRALDLAAPARRGALLVIVGLAAGQLSRPGADLVYLLQEVAGGAGLAEAFVTATFVPDAASTLARLSGWAILPVVVWLAWSHRSLAAAALAVYGGLRVGIEGLPGALNAFSLYTTLVALAALHAVHRDGAFQTPGLPRLPSYFAAGAALVTGFFVALVVGVQVAGDSALGLAGVTFAALLVGLGAAAIAFPQGSGWRGEGARESADRRLGPYGAAMHAEVAEGLRGPPLAAKLAGLRAELGVSEQEHAALEYGLTAAAAGGAGGAPAGALEPGGLFLGRYRVVKPLGQGGGGATHLCRDELVGRDVVIKVIRSPLRTAEGLQQVLREARAIGGIQHPNVLTLLDVQQVGDEVFIVMEHAVGGSLAARLAQGPCAREEFRPLAEGTLRALEAVHAAGVVHRDVKPSNILLTAEGLPKLADFGIAHIRGFETTAGPGDGAAAGTVRYMSPEQARGRKAGPQSDLFSAAATLYEAYTGKPFLDALPAESPMELQMRAARGVAFDRPLDGPAPLRAWFARALAPEPAARFAGAREMREALARALTAVA